MKHLLTLEDLPIQDHVFKTLLEKDQIRMSVDNNGEEVIAKAHEIKSDLILMDIVMPGKKGFQATRGLIRNPETSTIRVINTTDQETDKILGMRQGAQDYRVKLANEKELMVSIDKALS